MFDLGKLAEGTLDTDDDYLVAHVAEVINSGLSSFFFVADVMTLQFFVFVILPYF